MAFHIARGTHVGREKQGALSVPSRVAAGGSHIYRRFRVITAWLLVKVNCCGQTMDLESAELLSNSEHVEKFYETGGVEYE